MKEREKNLGETDMKRVQIRQRKRKRERKKRVRECFPFFSLAASCLAPKIIDGIFLSDGHHDRS